MYKTSEAYFAESHGLVVGKNHGIREGYEAGWNDAIAHTEKQQAAILHENRELSFALNSLSVICFAALSALKSAPEHHRDVAMQIYATEVNRLLAAGPEVAGAIRAVPHTDGALLDREGDIASAIRFWFDQSLKKHQQ